MISLVMAHVLLPLTVAVSILLMLIRPRGIAEVYWVGGGALLLVLMARLALEKSKEVLAVADFNHDALDAALRAAAIKLKIKPGQMFQPIRVAVCGRKNSPPLFETLVVLGRETSLKRIEAAIEMI